MFGSSEQYTAINFVFVISLISKFSSTSEIVAYKLRVEIYQILIPLVFPADVKKSLLSAIPEITLH